MRLVIATVLLLTATHGMAAGQSVQPAALASDEVLLEIDAVGETRVPADKISVLASFVGQGTSLAEARRSAEQAKARLIDAAKAAGARSGDINPDPPPTRIGFVGNEAIDPAEGGWSVLAPNTAVKRVNGYLEVRLPDVAHVERIRTALEEAGATNVQGPTFALSDDTQARRVAKADAIRRAREEAEAYARAANMRVVRLVRISERAASGSVRMNTMQDFMELLGRNATGRNSGIEVRAVVGVDFALAPK